MPLAVVTTGSCAGYRELVAPSGSGPGRRYWHVCQWQMPVAAMSNVNCRTDHDTASLRSLLVGAKYGELKFRDSESRAKCHCCPLAPTSDVPVGLPMLAAGAPGQNPPGWGRRSRLTGHGPRAFNLRVRVPTPNVARGFKSTEERT